MLMVQVKPVLAGDLGAGWQIAALATLQQILNSAGDLPGISVFSFGFGLHPPKSWHCVQGRVFESCQGHGDSNWGLLCPGSQPSGSA